jgi:hypothetical protein
MQKAIFPISKTWISQKMDEGSHKGTKAIDFGVLLPYNVTKLTAPFDGTVVYVDPQSKGGGIAFQSENEVMYANGSIDYMTLWTGHDNFPPKVGSKFKQGQVYSSMGTAGGVPTHCHLEVQRGKFIKPTKFIYIDKNIGNVYKLDNTVEPYNCLFLDNDTIIKKNDYIWKRVSDNVLIEEAVKDDSKNQIKVLVSNLRIRVEPSINSKIIGYAKKNGIYNNFESCQNDNYTWYKIGENQWIANNGKWIEFFEQKDYKKMYNDLLSKIEKIKNIIK